jgi:hypothetical protein
VHILIAAFGACRVRMHLDMAGVNHEPCKIRIIHQWLQKDFPDPAVTPTAKPAVRMLPLAIIRRQITPRSACPQNPEYGVDA